MHFIFVTGTFSCNLIFVTGKFFVTTYMSFTKILCFSSLKKDLKITKVRLEASIN